jgi:hypothetical protein
MVAVDNQSNHARNVLKFIVHADFVSGFDVLGVVGGLKRKATFFRLPYERLSQICVALRA